MKRKKKCLLLESQNLTLSTDWGTERFMAEKKRLVLCRAVLLD
jgi:hypothetical protein